MPSDDADARAGFMANKTQVMLMILNLVCMGWLLGVSRSLIPLMAGPIYGQKSHTAAFAFILTFGIAKGFANSLVGILSDKYGRRVMLVIGCIVSLPVPIVVLLTKNWVIISVSNVGLGIGQGLIDSALIFMLVDIFGPQRRGIAVGVAECTIYSSVGVASAVSSELAEHYGFLPVPFVVATIAAVIGLLNSLIVRDTMMHVQTEVELVVMQSPDGEALTNAEDTCALHGLKDGDEPTEDDHGVELLIERAESNSKGVNSIANPTAWQAFQFCLTHRGFLSLIQAGMINNLKDGMCWGLFPLFFSETSSLSTTDTGRVLVAYPLTWGVAQLFTGAASDLYGRKWLICLGLMIQAISLGATVLVGAVSQHSSVVLEFRMVGWVTASVFLGIGTAMIYPVLQAAAADEVLSTWRASCLGVFRLFRDLGYAVGAIVSGLLADAFGIPNTILVVAVLLLGSSFWVAVALHPSDATRENTSADTANSADFSR